MYKEIGIFEHSQTILGHMKAGVFLTTRHKDKTNTMTIGWGGITVIWGRPMMIVLVRDSRATYNLIEGSLEFSVSVPYNRNLGKELAFCGSKSMRDHDKFQECGLTPLPARKIQTPVIKEAGLHYECKVLYKQKLNQDNVPDIVKQRYYNPDSSNLANHTVYFGEIVDAYIYEEDN